MIFNLLRQLGRHALLRKWDRRDERYRAILTAEIDASAYTAEAIRLRTWWFYAVATAVDGSVVVDDELLNAIYCSLEFVPNFSYQSPMVGIYKGYRIYRNSTGE